MSTTTNDSSRVPQEPERRSFLTRLSAVSVGTLVAVFPFAAGWGVATSPLQKKNHTPNSDDTDDGFIRVCPLDSVPADGVPRPFAVVADVVDAWTRSVNQRIGEVYLSRTEVDGKASITAFTATCPHLGCAVEFDTAQSHYTCPCHASAFAKDGQRIFGPSLRGLDQLEAKIEERGGVQEVLVRYERFRTGIAEKEVVA